MAETRFSYKCRLCGCGYTVPARLVGGDPKEAIITAAKAASSAAEAPLDSGAVPWVWLVDIHEDCEYGVGLADLQGILTT